MTDNPRLLREVITDILIELKAKERIERLTREARCLEDKGMIIQASQARMSAKITAWLYGLPEEV